MLINYNLLKMEEINKTSIRLSSKKKFMFNVVKKVKHQNKQFV